nr:hypothetical protein [uncultured Sphingomonas sp.]
MTALFTTALFSAAMATAICTIAGTIVPQLGRIRALLVAGYEA